ncbi:MAG: hypothetical protein EPO26_05935 [Chloroflexota bacterium]|nr:MAG: hypothetical protein EPO26_05935 [Chloroflexota bacterium]
MSTRALVDAGLNPAQIQAVENVTGPMLVLAGPGSGKTRVITYRIIHLIRDHRVPPYNIAAVTFTNKAARSMMERLDAVLPGQTRHLTMGTFHSVSSRILRRDGDAVGIGSNFTIYDDTDQIAIVKAMLREMNLDEKRFAPRSILAGISKHKSELRSPEDAARLTSSYWEEIVQRVYRGYQTALEARNALDFDDLLTGVIRLFRGSPDVEARYQERYQYVLVDEFQDTNVAQYEIVKRLAGRHRNLCVVGDEDQSVYSWRGANFRNVLDFEVDYPDARVVLLEQNYRSTGTILGAAQAVISANTQRKKKALWTENPPGEKIRVFEAYNEDEEATFLANEIERGLQTGQRRYRDFAVMYRTNAQSRAVEKALVRRRIPHKVVGVRFYDRKEVKDLLCYLRLIHNPDDDQALERVLNVPPRGLGDKSVAELGHLAAGWRISRLEAIRRLREEHLAAVHITGRAVRAFVDFADLFDRLASTQTEVEVAALLDQLLTESGYEQFVRDGTDEGNERWLNVQELMTVARQYAGLEGGAGLAAFLEETALVADADMYDETSDAVTVITLHAAKGLEFSVVFLIGMEEGICPHSRSFEDDDAMEEERRLAYVGITRARESLYLVYAFRRALYGGAMTNMPSRFIAEIPKQFVRLPGRGDAKSASVVARPSLLNPSFASTRSPAAMAPARPRPPREFLRQPGASPPPAQGKRAVERIFSAGDRVTHARFGEGVVVSSNLVSDDEEVTVAFAGIGVKKLLQSFAQLARA